VSSIEQLKEEARAFEQNEQWEKALDLDSQAIDRLSADENADIALFNRDGDLATKIESYAQAVAFYERAVDYYMDAGLPNNAVAVCRKMMRNLPDRYSIHLKMGQIRAAQGFIRDARTSFVTYAERVQRAGYLDEAFRALVEFVKLAPDGYEMCMTLAGQLERNHRNDEALIQYVGAYRIMQRKGLGALAEAAASKVQRLDPEQAAADPSFGQAASSGEEGDALDGSSLADPGEPEIIGPVDLPLMSFDDVEDEYDAAKAEEAAAEAAEEAAAEEAAAKEKEAAAVAKAAEEAAASKAAAIARATEEAAARAAADGAAGDAQSDAPPDSGYVDLGAVLLGEGAHTEKSRPVSLCRMKSRRVTIKRISRRCWRSSGRRCRETSMWAM
jgi:tetratricopeptide (TPR) repeat protein